MDKAALLEDKVKSVVEKLYALKQENDRLRKECDALQSHVRMLGGESGRAQGALQENERLRRNHQQAILKIEKALQKFAGLRN